MPRKQRPFAIYFRSPLYSSNSPREKSRLGAFILWLLPGAVSYQNGAIKFIERFYPVPEIVQRLNKAQVDKVHWHAEHAAAIERFWNFYNQESSSPTPPELDEGQPGYQT
jgi:hypothetical protein